MNRHWSFKPYTDERGQRWIDGQGWIILVATIPMWLWFLP